ncbi:amino acid ABC transporter permease [Catelliglobosispora koreensis]|uniref:amino acid ABC transporter permease n=1 Tax=Catelliglobosispora koreensis TaxID=129052 RepID=UPI000379296C|nr:amino acid ABC transporter permease [Catelliglobosispora koreensis]
MNVLWEQFPVFRDGFLLTFQLSFLSAIGALLVGTLVAVLRISPVPPLRWLGTSYVNLFRNIPLTAVFVFVVVGLPLLGSSADFLKIPGLDQIFTRLGIDLPYFRFSIIALSLYTAAFVCEALRSGINAVPSGQAEAARSIGLTFTQNLRFIVLPQAWRAAIVPLGSVIIAMIKNSAIAGFMGLYGDLSSRGQELVSAGVNGVTYPLIPVFIAISLGFLIMTVPLGLLLDRIEKNRMVKAR